MTSNQNKNLLDRLMILEKFIELKTNECAYYRTKVHLMQMNTLQSRTTRQTLINESPHKTQIERSSSEQTSNDSTRTNQNQSASIHRHNRRYSLPTQRRSLFRQKLHKSRLSHLSISSDQFTKTKHLPFSPPKERRHRRKIHYKNSARNQNHYDEIASDSNKRYHPSKHMYSRPRSLNGETTINELLSYMNEHVRQVTPQDKNIQCNETDLRQVELSSKSSRTILMIELPDRLIRTLLENKKRPRTTKLKLHLSSDTLSRLIESIRSKSSLSHANPCAANQFDIKSQFGNISASVHRKALNHDENCQVVTAKANIKSQHECQLPIIRHLVRTRSNVTEKKRITAETNLHTRSHKHQVYRRKQTNLQKSSSMSHEESSSIKTSSDDNTQSAAATSTCSY